jgi:hypothetical protein
VPHCVDAVLHCLPLRRIGTPFTRGTHMAARATRRALPGTSDQSLWASYETRCRKQNRTAAATIKIRSMLGARIWIIAISRSSAGSAGKRVIRTESPVAAQGDGRLGIGVVSCTMPAVIQNTRIALWCSTQAPRRRHVAGGALLTRSFGEVPAT